MPDWPAKGGSDGVSDGGENRCDLALNGMHRRLEWCAAALRGQIRPVCRCSFPIKIPNKIGVSIDEHRRNLG